MKRVQSTIWLLGISAILVFSVGTTMAHDGSSTTADMSAKASAAANTDIHLKSPTWPKVLERLFGTPNDGLVDGNKAFLFHATDVKLTAAESANFFTSTSASTSVENLSALIQAVESLHGNVKIEGTIDSKPFELKIAGRELKLEGLTLTTAQRDMLVVELRGISGLHEAKIEALVDGKLAVTKMARNHDRLELIGRDRQGERPDRAGKDHQRLETPQRIEIDHSINADIHQSTNADLRQGGIEHTGRIELLEGGRLGLGKR